MQHNLTIAICTYNRAHILPEALVSLLRQTVSQDNYSLLIIDNNSTDNTQETVASFKDKFTDIRIIVENNQGLSHARNRALKECQTEWLAFLDDDAKAHPDWVETILQSIKKGDFDGFGGPYYAWHRYGPAPHWLPEDFGTYESPQDYGLLEGDTYIPGGNSVLRCDAARSIGTFSTELGMRGNRCGYGEETLFFERMRAASYRMGYVPQLKIDHCVLPYKYTLRWQLYAAFISGRNFISLQSSLGNIISPLYLFIKLIKISIKNLAYFRTYKFKKSLFLYTKQIVNSMGCIIGSFSNKG